NGADWEVSKPVHAKASTQNVRSLVDNLKELKLKDVIDKSSANYAQYDLTDDKALHVTAYADGAKKVDLFFGKAGSRGQAVRLGDREGVYVATGYSGYLYTREVKNWRETTLLKFEDANVIGVDIKNRHGELSFSANDGKWSASFAKKGAAKGALAKFDETKIKDMLRTYKML